MGGGGGDGSLSFRMLFTRGLLEVSFLRTYEDAGRVHVRLEAPTEDSAGGFTLAASARPPP